MKLRFLLPSFALLSWGIAPVAVAEPNSPTNSDIDQKEIEISEVTKENDERAPIQISSFRIQTASHPITNIPRLKEIEFPKTEAKYLVQEPASTEVKLSEIKPTDTSHEETKPTDASPSQTKHTDASHEEIKPTDASPSQTKHTDASPSQTKPTNASHEEIKPTDASLSEAKPINASHEEAKLTDASPSQTKPTNASPSQTKPTNASPSQTKPTNASPSQTKPTDATPSETEPTDAEIELLVIGDRDRDPLPQSSPVYVVPQEEIEKQGSTSSAEVLRSQPGFAVNDAGFGADIHTGTYYRGQSINQSVILLNGRPLGSNINTYHGTTDLNSIPVESIDRIELSSGTSSTLYGSQAVGGVINIITKKGQGAPRFNGTAQFGSLSQSNYQSSFGGSTGKLRYNLSYQRYYVDNDYSVPVGAANRNPATGRLFNADTATSSYFGSATLDVDRKNTLSLDVTKLSSRRGLIYFGFPLQRDRLNHDGLNAGLSWKTRLSGENSVVTTTLGYNQDYFNTYGPTTFNRQEYYRTATLDTQGLTARVEHQWRTSPGNYLRWGFDMQNSDLNGDVFSTSPDRIAFNEKGKRNVFSTGIFAVNTWNITDALQLDLGVRENINSQFGNYLNPSVGSRWAITPAIAVRGSWAGVQRNPGLDQLYFFDTVHGWLPNPNLKSEIGSSWTAGVDIAFSRKLTGQFTYFGSSLDNRLGVVAGKWQNIGLVDTNGFEAALKWRIAPQLSTFINYTYTDAKIKTGAEKGLQLGLIPYSVAQIGISFQSNGWQLNLYGSYNSGSRRSIYTLPNEKPTDFSPSFFNLDLNGRIPVTRYLGLVVYLENLAGVKYERVNRIYSPGLTFRVGIQSSF